MLCRVVAHLAEIGFEQLGDQTLTRAASQSSLGTGAYSGNALAPLCLNRLHDSPLADAVAVADLGVVRQIGCLQQGHAGRCSEEQIGPARGHGAPGHEHVHERARRLGVAQENRAGDRVVAHDQLLVDAVPRLAIHDHFIVWTRRSCLTHRGEFNTHDLELGTKLRTEIGRARIRVRQHVCQDSSHVPDGIDQSVRRATMFHTLAEGEDVGVARPHLVVADDALVDGQARGCGDLRDGTNAGAHDDHVGVQARPVLEVQPGDAVVRAHDSRRNRVREDLHSHSGDGCAEHVAGL